MGSRFGNRTLNFSALDDLGNTALHYAVARQQGQVANLLVRYHPELTLIANNYGDNATTLAERTGQLDVAGKKAQFCYG